MAEDIGGKIISTIMYWTAYAIAWPVFWLAKKIWRGELSLGRGVKEYHSSLTSRFEHKRLHNFFWYTYINMGVTNEGEYPSVRMV